MMLPPWAYAAGGASLLLIGFGAGWQVESWRWSASLYKAEKAVQAKADKQRDVIHDEARQNAQESQDAQQVARTRETEIRTIYRDVAVPANCEPPAAVARVLNSAIESANSRARGEPGGGLPSPSASASAAGRP